LSFHTVRVELSTHSDGGLTNLDFAVALEINGLPTDR
jgi:4a-hydroxytetrahydrobiopterin dehydratase